jgi:hypothetical protein
MMTETTKDNLCDVCLNSEHIPECWPNKIGDIEWGNGLGNDNIISCTNFQDVII